MTPPSNGSPAPLAISATSHGINYLPEYWAEATGLFAGAGLAVTNRPRDPWTGVLDDLESGAADVALGGLWVPAMYASTDRDYVAVAQVNDRFSKVVITREPVDDFDWSWLAGKTVLVPGAGGTAPYEFPAGLMREAGIDPRAARYVRDLDGPMLIDLWNSGLGDAFFVDLFTGMKLVDQGGGAISLRLAELGGVMSNSVYYVKRARLDELHARLVPFVAALTTAMGDLHAASDLDDAISLAATHWPSTPTSVVRDVVTELSANGTWATSRIDENACERWTRILFDAGLTTQHVRFDQIVDTSVLDAIGARA